MRFSKPIGKSINPVHHNLFKHGIGIGKEIHVFQQSIADALNHKLKGRFGSYWLYTFLLLLLVFTAYCTCLLTTALMNLFNPF